MKLKVSYTYPDGPTLNGNIYSEEVLAAAFEEAVFKEMNQSKAIPVLGTTQGPPIGCASATLDGKKVELDVTIHDKVYEKLLQDLYDTLGISLAGMCEKEASSTLTAIKYREALLTAHSAVSCSMEIVEQGKETTNE